MTLAYILIFSLFALAAGMLVDRRWRNWLIFAGSLLAVYALQPATPIWHLDFWLPTLSLALCGLGWVVTAHKTAGKLDFSRTSQASAVLMAGVVLLVGLTRYFDPLCCLIPTRPPELVQVLVGLGLVAIAAFILARLAPAARFWPALFILLIAGLFIILKTDFLAQAASAWLRLLNGQPANLALAGDLRWLGFSYIAFRLLHTLRDRQTGRLPILSLQEYVSYVVFFPSLTAGPIDRAERFVKDFNLSKNDARLAARVEGGKRIAVGLFKKFVLADTLALVALSSVNFSQVQSTFWMWALLYAYALRIYFDFSGYTDIAIGIGRLMGIKLPENFDRPYLKPNLTSFWNSWHMTLAQWFRTYIFNPLTRALRTARNPLPAYLVILIGQLTTMCLIGLWHGVTWNFLLWGAWHGLGLFIHNRWLEFYRSHFGALTFPAWLQRTLSILGILLTFNFVALGWVWFALPLPSQSWTVMLKLFGR
jgi:D-alanyl-lipoteichoic acid acyltransferase DltB (MBOAT superfamily)